MCSAGNAEKFLHLLPASFYITILQQMDTLGSYRFIMICFMACFTIQNVVYIFQDDLKIRCRRIKFWSAHF